MGRKRLVWKLFPSFLAITMLALFAVTWYSSRSLRNFYMDKTAQDLGARASLLERTIATSLADEKRVDNLCKELGAASSTRITVVLPGGRVIGDTEEDPLEMENHGDRPEIVEALREGSGVSIRYSSTLEKMMMYVAHPMKIGERVLGVVRTSMPINSIDETIGAIQTKIALAALMVAGLLGVLSLFVSRKLSRPLEEMKEGAQRFASGDLKTRVSVPDSEEMAALAGALNKMAAQLDEKIRRVLTQQGELEAVLASMTEGVLAVDFEGQIMYLNGALKTLMGVEPDSFQNKTVGEVFRSADLIGFAARAASEEGPIEEEIEIVRGKDRRFVQARGAPLLGSGERRIGTLLVLNDITRLKRLENMRRDFAANVSHELRTPITAIKGFAETLYSGALENREEAERFLRIIASHSDRLNSIIDDLLALSRIEKDTERKRVSLEESDVGDVMDAVLRTYEERSTGRRIELTRSGDLRARIDPPLLEQAAMNLIDNALKYSDPGTDVEVEVLGEGGEVLIRVRDRGIGIPPENLERIFERFYRVDKARSRDLGGTGLGLAIVKHIALAHGGRVSVESTPGAGSTFTIHLPAL